jgi:hypothetical protein
MSESDITWIAQIFYHLEHQINLPKSDLFSQKELKDPQKGELAHSRFLILITQKTAIYRNY